MRRENGSDSPKNPRLSGQMASGATSRISLNWQRQEKSSPIVHSPLHQIRSNLWPADKQWDPLLKKKKKVDPISWEDSAAHKSNSALVAQRDHLPASVLTHPEPLREGEPVQFVSVMLLQHCYYLYQDQLCTRQCVFKSSINIAHFIYYTMRVALVLSLLYTRSEL